MSLLQNKKILLGISGGIAAYKCAELTRRLVEQGAQVRVVMTPAAKAFITPLTMQAVSGHPVSDDLLDPAAEAAMGHIELAKWADLILITPASADLIARLAQGMANDLLTTLCLASAAPTVVSPAMNQQMWAAPATQRNIEQLKKDGRFIIGPGVGEQACGDVGAGRMLEPNQIIEHLPAFFLPQVLQGKKLLITAGPTQEAIDPVRYISNHSSGKMGYALASAAMQLGALVTLVSGPTALEKPVNCELIAVKSAKQMLEACQQVAHQSDIFIACAAVADYQVADVAEQKIKKTQHQLNLQLTKNPDILASIAQQLEKPFCIGFAAETQDVAHYAKDKMQRKNLDMIIANDVSNQQIGFNSDQNAVTVYWQDQEQSFPATDKKELAVKLLQLIAKHYTQQV
ncbi:bifunctional phosphopantothenoylcysteine decarboxylase/phosphopantothenate--cysteine ligase CoaBC [Catenovulum sp. 2E275]|uniref:bifunctional phosphopantothenoylcysteine decarboxylase/phosphopantothenate--cysteine ligase CoaBC n=1 Tax=Catenovulum sp. 2E275 TaxID=2980497 RepID=UPI0021D38993|nr:bifunctional phosphopantothenoylcysteine decarboxylase/phosphopantothenate--cysteine ligase CoaBC [Catenovulum sp. 2E275]MCU4677589.1 bifunctional phosphopantothenoylcysteine decarboxylase/phosphopantothenate--cysteine ligase CoaBC [Catenovulum sp. 2E275]